MGRGFEPHPPYEEPYEEPYQVDVIGASAEAGPFSGLEALGNVSGGVELGTAVRVALGITG